MVIVDILFICVKITTWNILWGDFMEKFNRTMRGYDPDEVKNFLDQAIQKVEAMNEDNKKKEEKIKLQEKKIIELSSIYEENQKLRQQNEQLKQKLERHERMEETLNKAIMMAQKTSDQMRLSAHKESETIIDDAKRNANRIVNEALLKAEKTELEANMLARNVRVFKKKIKDVIESQLEVVNDLDKIEM